jgi:hypothetical protein
MSQIKFQGNAGGTGSVTIQSPNTNNGYTQTTLPYNGTIPVTNGTGALVTGVPIYENTQSVSASYSISSGSSAVSAGPVTLSAGVTVTIPTGSRWVIV